MKLMCGNANQPLAAAICNYLDAPLTKADVKRFKDGEIFAVIEENVRGQDVFVIQSTSAPANDNLMELLICMDALTRASAKRITAVLPYFGYARQDRKVGGRTPISAKLVANLITTAGADRVLSMELHAGQIQGFFDIPTDNLFCTPVMEKDIRETFGSSAKELMIVSPDVGGVVRARALANRFGADLAIVDKRRISGSEIAIEHIIGSVEGRNVIIVDDMISTGGSISEAASVARRHGAKAIALAASHAVLCGPAVARLDGCPADKILVTDSIPRRGDSPRQLEVVSVAPLLARAIRNIHRCESVSSLFEEVS